ncbi:hypothetical protein VXM67_23295 [Pseudomonas sp. Rh2]|uniref:hypothetical protein n=1 Tax=Pseudomonas sp. Rh2 TaxID=3112956 RepID=UPI00345CB4A1
MVGRYRPKADSQRRLISASKPAASFAQSATQALSETKISAYAAIEYWANMFISYGVATVPLMAGSASEEFNLTS